MGNCVAALSSTGGGKSGAPGPDAEPEPAAWRWRQAQGRQFKGLTEEDGEADWRGTFLFAVLADTQLGAMDENEVVGWHLSWWTMDGSTTGTLFRSVSHHSLLNPHTRNGTTRLHCAGLPSSDLTS